MNLLPDITTTSYGADQHGLICGYVLRPGAPGQPIDCEDAKAWLDGEPGTPDDSFVWLHFNQAHAGTEAWLRGTAPLAHADFESAREGSPSTRIERTGDALFAVVNDVTFDFSFDASDVATLWLSLRDRVVITLRLHPLRAIDRLRAAVKRGEPLATPVALLDHLLRDQADELQHIARTASARIDKIEDRLLAHPEVEHASELSRLRRLTVRLQRLLAPEPGALMRVLASPPAWVPDVDIETLRQASEEFATTLRDISTLQDRVKLLQEESASRVDQRNSRSLFLLTMVTVLALPINLTASLFGMNVGGIPLAQHPHGFLIAVVLIGGFTLLVAWYAVRRLLPPR